MGPMVPWAHGPMGLWAYGPMGPWAHGPMDPWAHGPMAPWAHGLGLVGPWAHGAFGRQYESKPSRKFTASGLAHSNGFVEGCFEQ